MAKSYSSELHGFLPLLRQVRGLYNLYAHNIPARVAGSIADAQRAEDRIKQSVGVELKGLKILEIGPGQFLSQAIFFAGSNDVVCIDRDVIAKGMNPLLYVRMLGTNGAMRTVKTIGRKLLGVDRQYASCLRSQLRLERMPRVTVKQMDVCDMKFESNSFDCVYCRSVLHQLPDPGRAAGEIARVLRPGGVAYISVHPYTSATGCLDPRIYTPRRNEVQGWPHLRPQLQHTLYSPNVYLNKLRLADWQRLFETCMPEGSYIVTPNDDPNVTSSAEQLQAAGELLDYTVEELTAGELVVIWRKAQVSEMPTAEYAAVVAFAS